MTARGRLQVVTLLDVIGPGGGGETLAREVLTRLNPDRFERTLCVSRWSEEASKASSQAVLEELRSKGVRFLGLSRRSPRQLRAWRPLLSLLRDERTDILHAHKFGSNVWASLVGPLAGTPVLIAHEHTWSFEGQPVRRFLDRRLIAPRVAAFLTVSRADLRRMIEIEKVDPAKLVFMPNGIPPPQPPSGRDMRVELGIPPDVPVVGTVATLRAQKALDVLIRAAQILKERFPRLRVLIAGEGVERRALERLITELGLEGTVVLLGFRPDVPDLLPVFDVAACSSDYEGTPLSILEYMEAGLPVVSTRVGGIPDVIEHGVHGLLVDRRDPRSLSTSIEMLLRDRARAAEMGRRGRDRRRTEFDISATVRRIESLYEDLHARVDGRSKRST
jgi:glycosyltransferase involved in cell wall biosynthesis